MKKLFFIFLSRPVTAIMFLFIVVVLGSASLFNLPIELNPNVEFPKLSISVRWQGVSSEAVEAFVTAPIEAQLSKIRGIKNTKSRSSQGYSHISLELHEKTDIDFIRIEINEKLSLLKDELPFGVSPPRLSAYVPEDFRDLQGFITYTISSNQSANAVRKYVKDNIEYPLMALRGISDVVIRGGNEREITIELDYEQIKILGITNNEIRKVISEIEKIGDVGVIKSFYKQIVLKINNKVKNVDVIKNQIIKTTANGAIIHLRDIAKVYDDFSEARNYYRINGKETVSLILSKEPGINLLELSETVYKKIAELENVFPKDYVITKEIDRSDRVRTELGELTRNGVISLILILIILLLIFRKIKYSLIIIVSIAFSLLFSFLLFYLFKIPLNIITISAFVLGFGFMVDNAIVVIDYLDKHENKWDNKRLTVVLNEVFSPVFASTLTTIGVFLPLLFLTGELRLYFEQFAFGVVFTLFASLVVSFTIIPMLFTRVIKKKDTTIIQKVSIARKAYTKFMITIFKWKKAAIIFLILIVGLPVWLIPDRIETPIVSEIYNPIFDSEIYSEIKPYINYALGGTLNLFFNHINRGKVWSFGEETYIYVRLELPNGNTIERMNELTKEFEKEILNYKNNIKTVIANVRDEESASIRIEFSQKQSETSFPYMLKNYLTAYATRLGGLNVSVYGYGPGFSNGGGSSFGFTVVAKGFNYKDVKTIAKEFKKIIVRNPRIDNIDIDRSINYWEKDTYEITAKVKRDDLKKYDIKIDELLNIIASNTKGNLSENKFYINDDEVKYKIKFKNYRNVQLNLIENLIIKRNHNTQLKVKDVVQFSEKKVLSSIHRENQRYIRNISFDYKGPYKYGNKFIEASLEKLDIPEGYTVEKREFKFRFGEEEEIDIWKILIISILLTFMISASLFESYKKPIYIMLAIPFAILGTIILFYFTELSLDRGAYAGLLLLVGLSVNNSIMLVDSLSRGGYRPNNEDIINMSFLRLRPIFTTTLTTAGALIPLLFASEVTFWSSLSYSVLGGIVLSSILIIIYVPFFYSVSSKSKITKWN